MPELHDQLLGGKVGERVEQALERLLMSADGDVDHSEGTVQRASVAPSPGRCRSYIAARYRSTAISDLVKPKNLSRSIVADGKYAASSDRLSSSMPISRRSAVARSLTIP
jgi:hypothetical protein